MPPVEAAIQQTGKKTVDFPGYSIVCEIGRGGMATVYRARQVMLDREVALKVLNPMLSSDPANAQRFLQEARMLASLDHPHVVSVYDVGVTPGGAHYFSMQLLEHGDLRARLQRGLEEPELVRILSAVADALAYAHARGYVHRDVTPANVLFDADGKPRLTDFGIARAMSVTSRITAMGLSVGTSYYMSPEQARGNEVDPRSDIYSLGVVCYECLTGTPPFNGEDSFAVAYSHVYEPVPPLPATLAKWQPLLDRCLAKNPEDRFQNCGQFIAALRRIAFMQAVVEQSQLASGSDTPTLVVGEPSESSDADEGTREEISLEDEEDSTEAPSRRWLGPMLAAMVAIVVAGAVVWGVSQRNTVFEPFTLEAADVDQADIVLQEPDTEGGVGLNTISALLMLAQQDFDARRYTTPPGDNALERYLGILRDHPAHEAARAGVERVVSVYVSLADQHVGDANPEQWLAHLARAEKLAQAHHVPTVLDAVAQRRQERVKLLLDQAENALNAREKAQAIALYQQVLAISPDTAAAKDGLSRAQALATVGGAFRDRLTQGDGPEMVITGAMAFSRTPITVGEFQRYWQAAGEARFLRALPTCRDRESLLRSLRKRTWMDPGFAQTSDHPVVCISATMAEDYVRWLSQESGKPYRLPQAGELLKVGVGATENCSAGNIRDAAYRVVYGGRDASPCNDGHATTSPVMAFKIASNGLRDTLGNVREWSADCASSGCRDRMVIGISWASPNGEAAKKAFPVESASNTIGFRVVQNIH